MNAIAIAILLGLSPLRAEDAPPKAAKSSWTQVKRWLDQLKAGLTESAVRRHQRDLHGLVAVAAVRGALQAVDDPDKPYFMGTEASKAERATRRERSELKKAVLLALDGKTDEAIKAFSAFEEAHPKSPLLEDCRLAREKIQAAAGPAEAAAAKSEPAAPEEQPAAPK